MEVEDDIESKVDKVCLDLAERCGVGPGYVRRMIEDYIKIVTNKFEPLSLYPKPRIRPVKIKTLRERLEDKRGGLMNEKHYI